MPLNYSVKINMTKNIVKYFLVGLVTLFVTNATQVNAFPIYAQQAYENPREATGRIVCANCHLAQKPAEIEVPQAVLPNTVFEAIVKIPYEDQTKQILGNGSKGSLNVGAVVILPKGFKLAPNSRLSEELKAKTKGVYIQPYSTNQDNILVVGPISGDKNKEIIFPILSPDPSSNKNAAFLKYPVFVGANRGRGQVYPTGDKTNNNVILSSTSGRITEISNLEKGGYEINIAKNNDSIIKEKISAGLELKVKEGENISVGQALTKDPNVGGFGQNETEIVLQSPARIKGMIGFFIIVTISQIFFVLKKKQWEKVQAAEINF
uniref:Cytochrome f n=1 Tax=Helminthora furcellata TaxID=1884666 RepID=A0A1G4NZD7_9FLOR|nr:Apocytochrome f [Helminthora furcellata]SCW21155.1 Apocytochrome f [Helminthora furcellata]SCW24015.1 Apocytochrome f [Helminthora furcellata]